MNDGKGCAKLSAVILRLLVNCYNYDQISTCDVDPRRRDPMYEFRRSLPGHQNCGQKPSRLLKRVANVNRRVAAIFRLIRSRTLLEWN